MLLTSAGNNPASKIFLDKQSGQRQTNFVDNDD
jgi:hypothetical protein